jgi:hypothetical protein
MGRDTCPINSIYRAHGFEDRLKAGVLLHIIPRYIMQQKHSDYGSSADPLTLKPISRQELYTQRDLNDLARFVASTHPGRRTHLYPQRRVH